MRQEGEKAVEINALANQLQHLFKLGIKYNVPDCVQLHGTAKEAIEEMQRW